jgi:hypothetical protein
MTTATQNAKQVKPRSKPRRSLAIIDQQGDSLTVGITVGKLTTHYVIDPLDSDFGRAFRFTKIDGTAYAVNIDGNESHCCCRGHINHARCKHVDCTRKLQELGLLPVAMPLPEEPGEILVWDDTTWD